MPNVQRRSFLPKPNSFLQDRMILLPAFTGHCKFPASRAVGRQQAGASLRMACERTPGELQVNSRSPPGAHGPLRPTNLELQISSEDKDTHYYVSLPRISGFDSHGGRACGPFVLHLRTDLTAAALREKRP